MFIVRYLAIACPVTLWTDIYVLVHISPALFSEQEHVSSPLWEGKPTILALELVRRITGIIATTIRATITVHLVSVYVITHVVITSFVL